MDNAIALKLREKFPPELVGKLPRVTCPDCADRRKTCTEHKKSKCGVCGAYVSERHIHIDYVGHADVTSRLIEADPDWNWEPRAEDEHGLPLFDTDDRGNPVGLWIKLTVGGVTRLGYGSVPSNQSDAVKVLIGDALRNAAMRFGVALDLWAKGDRADPTAENATASAGQAARRSGNGRKQQQGDGGDWRNLPPVNRPRNGNGQGQPAQPPVAADDELLGAWAAKIDEITSVDDAGLVLGELAESGLDSRRFKVIEGAIGDKIASLGGRLVTTRSAEERGAKPVPTGKGDDGEWVQGWQQRLAAAGPDDLGDLQAQIGPAVKARTITPGKSAELAKAVGERRRELQGAPA